MGGQLTDSKPVRMESSSIGWVLFFSFNARRYVVHSGPVVEVRDSCVAPDGCCCQFMIYPVSLAEVMRVGAIGLDQLVASF